MAEPALRLVGDTAADTFPWPGTGEMLSFRDAHYRIDEQAEKNAALHKLVESQAVSIRRLEKRVAEDEDPATHPQGAEIVALIDLWRNGTGHKKAKIGVARLRMVRARIKDGFAITLDEGADPEPTLELAVIGICAYPFRVFDRRYRDGNPSNRDDDLSAAMKDEKHVEAMARLGFKALREGWTPEGGWPQ